MMRDLKVLMLTRYGRQGASSRMRSIQYVQLLGKKSIDCTVSPFFDDAVLNRKYRVGRYGLGQLVVAYWARIRQMLRAHQFDLVWVEKEALPWLPAWLERLLLGGTPYVLDYDDAVFHNYDLHRKLWVRRIYGGRLDRLMAGASLVVGGNDYLAQRATSSGATWVEVLPTTVDLSRYSRPVFARRADGQAPVIVWIGSPSTTRYLLLIRTVLQALAQRRHFRLRVIGGGSLEIPGVDLEVLPWSEASEVAAIGECDVGVMPLEDSPWERGKCGYKLIQYMACGLPVVASPVGANCSIVGHGVNGFLAATSEEWVNALETLLSTPSLRRSLGQAGRRRVEEEFCIQVTAPRLADMLRRAGAVA